MSEQIVQVADASPSTKNMRTIQQTAGGNTVQSEVIVLATGAANAGDTYDARQIRTLTSSDIVTAILQNATFIANNVASAATDKALEVKISSLGSALVNNTLPVSISASVNVSQNTNPWTVAGQQSEGSGPTPGKIEQAMVAKDAGGFLQFLPLSSVGFVFAPAVPVIFAPSDIGTVTVSQNFLGANDKPDVTANQSGILKVTNANIPLLATDNQNNLLIRNTPMQTSKNGWGPGWGNFRGW